MESESESEPEKKRGRFMDDDLKVLPPEIITEILSRLPADSAIGCRGICKQWRSLIDHPSFVDTHIRQVISSSPSNPKKFGNYLIPNSCAYSSGFFLCARQGRKSLHLELIEYNDGGGGGCCGEEKTVVEFKPSKTITGHPFTFNRKNRDTVIMSSCNGLVFMGSTKPKYINDMFVCNPFTREYVNLCTVAAALRRWRLDKKGYMAYGFGYLPSTNEYKVVSIYYSKLDLHKGMVSVYTLGSGKWRNRGNIPLWLFSKSSPGFFANGAIHWFTKFNKKDFVVSFDLADEKFRHVVVFPPRAPSPNYYLYTPGVLGGCLCVIRSDRTRCESPKEIWILNVFPKKEEEMDEFSWNKKFNIPWKGISTSKAAAEVVLKSGKILLRGGTCLVSYDPKTEALNEDDANSYPWDWDTYNINIIPYTKSFVSLKALGEEDAKCWSFVANEPQPQ